MHSQDRDELDELGESKSDQHHEPRSQPVGEGGGSRSGRRGKRRSGVCFAEYNRMSLEDCVEGEGGPGPGPCLQSLCWVRYRESGF